MAENDKMGTEKSDSKVTRAFKAVKNGYGKTVSAAKTTYEIGKKVYNGTKKAINAVKSGYRTVKNLIKRAKDNDDKDLAVKLASGELGSLTPEQIASVYDILKDVNQTRNPHSKEANALSNLKEFADKYMDAISADKSILTAGNAKQAAEWLKISQDVQDKINHNQVEAKTDRNNNVALMLQGYGLDTKTVTAAEKKEAASQIKEAAAPVVQQEDNIMLRQQREKEAELRNKDEKLYQQYMEGKKVEAANEVSNVKENQTEKQEKKEEIKTEEKTLNEKKEQNKSDEFTEEDRKKLNRINDITLEYGNTNTKESMFEFTVKKLKEMENSSNSEKTNSPSQNEQDKNSIPVNTAEDNKEKTPKWDEKAFMEKEGELLKKYARSSSFDANDPDGYRKFKESENKKAQVNDNLGKEQSPAFSSEQKNNKEKMQTQGTPEIKKEEPGNDGKSELTPEKKKRKNPIDKTSKKYRDWKAAQLSGRIRPKKKHSRQSGGRQQTNSNQGSMNLAMMMKKRDNSNS